MKHNSKNLLIMVVVWAFIGGCTNIRTQPLLPVNNPTSVDQQEYIKPLTSMWLDAEFPQFTSKEGWTFILYCYQLRPDATVLLYTLSDHDVNQIVTNLELRIVDDLGQINPLIEILPLVKIDRLEAGAMSFQPRQPGSKELIFQILTKSNGEIISETKMTKFHQGEDDQSDRMDSIYFMTKEENWEQAGYKLAFWGWGIPPDLPVPGKIEWPEQTPERPGTLPTPVPDIHAPWSEVAAGITPQMEATLQIQNPETGQIQYLAMQMLSDSQVLGFFEGSVVKPIPILGESLTEPTNPYPTP